MNQFDDFLKTKAREESEDIPDCVIERIEQTLSLLSERENKTEVSGNFSKYAIMAAGFLLVFLIIPLMKWMCECGSAPAVVLFSLTV